MFLEDSSKSKEYDQDMPKSQTTHAKQANRTAQTQNKATGYIFQSKIMLKNENTLRITPLSRNEAELLHPIGETRNNK